MRLSRACRRLANCPLLISTTAPTRDAHKSTVQSETSARESRQFEAGFLCYPVSPASDIPLQGGH
nr:Tryptophanyl-tRNA synthetase [Methylocystis sp. SC2]